MKLANRIWFGGLAVAAILMLYAVLAPSNTAALLAPAVVIGSLLWAAGMRFGHGIAHEEMQEERDAASRRSGR